MLHVFCWLISLSSRNIYWLFKIVFPMLMCTLCFPLQFKHMQDRWIGDTNYELCKCIWPNSCHSLWFLAGLLFKDGKNFKYCINALKSLPFLCWVSKAKFNLFINLHLSCRCVSEVKHVGPDYVREMSWCPSMRIPVGVCRTPRSWTWSTACQERYTSELGGKHILLCQCLCV